MKFRFAACLFVLLALIAASCGSEAASITEAAGEAADAATDASGDEAVSYTHLTLPTICSV